MNVRNGRLDDLNVSPVAKNCKVSNKLFGALSQFYFHLLLLQVLYKFLLNSAHAWIFRSPFLSFLLNPPMFYIVSSWMIFLKILFFFHFLTTRLFYLSCCFPMYLLFLSAIRLKEWKKAIKLSNIWWYFQFAWKSGFVNAFGYNLSKIPFIVLSCWFLKLICYFFGRF